MSLHCDWFHGVRQDSEGEAGALRRRAYLGIIGRIPTEKEARVFLDDSSKEKRAELVDSLTVSQKPLPVSWRDLTPPVSSFIGATRVIPGLLPWQERALATAENLRSLFPQTAGTGERSRPSRTAGHQFSFP